MLRSYVPTLAYDLHQVMEIWAEVLAGRMRTDYLAGRLAVVPDRCCVNALGIHSHGRIRRVDEFGIPVT